MRLSFQFIKLNFPEKEKQDLMVMEIEFACRKL